MGHEPVLGLEIDAQAVELLPRWESLHLNVNVGPVLGVNLALALNAAVSVRPRTQWPLSNPRASAASRPA
ncbi:MAG TPA: hypothetical protein VFX33_16065 [Actinomycetales bacterium]|nr:hypothetical protein [Actinomycetales bacterium]